MPPIIYKLRNKMKTTIILLLSLLLPLTALAKKEEPLKYDIAPAGVSAEGMTLVKISLYVEKPGKATVDLLKKAAVHGIIFRGLGESGVTGYSSQRPLVSSPTAAQQYGDFFDTFFQDGGQYLSYANMVESTTQSVKVSKNEYRVTAIVNISTSQLRRALQDAGVARRMTEGF